MKNKIEILGIIPARSGSKTIKNKNLIKIKGNPLIYYTLKEAKKSKLISKLIVSTDSIKIANFCKRQGAEIPFIRPKKISRDNSKDSDVINHAYNFFFKKKIIYKYIVYLRPTSPLRKHKDIDKAIRKMIYNKKFSSLRSIKKISSNEHPYWMVKKNKNLIEPFSKKNNYTKFYRKQLLPDCFKLSGFIDIIDTKNCNKKNIYGKKTTFFDVNEIDIDVDTINDVILLNKVM